MRRKNVVYGIAVLAGVAIIAVASSVSLTPAGERHHSGAGMHGGSGMGGSPMQSRVQKGLDIAPVQLNLQGRNRALVGMGSYLVNAVGSCNDCHSCPSFAPGHNPYDGVGDGAPNPDNYLAGGVPFALGPTLTVHSANLTPDANGLPAGLTFDEFLATLRTGHDQDTGQVLQVMPWPIIRNMNNHDLRAIYEYLSAIPPAQAGSCQFAGQ